MYSKHISDLLIFLATAIVILSPTIADAADLKITDVDGNVVEVRNVKIDYTSYSFMYTPDFEYSGIRAYQGDGVVTAKWERIDQVTITGKQTDATPYRLKAEVTLVGGQPKPLDLMMDSKKGLVGETDLGEFSIDLEQVKNIVILKETNKKDKASVPSLSNDCVTGLKVTDSKGNVVDIKKVRIDYTSYSFMYTPDFEYSGIRAYQGRGVVMAKWERIDQVTITGKQTDATPYRLKAEVTLVGGQPKPLDLMMDSKKGLVGETDLGEFSIDLEQVRKIVVVKETRTKE